MASKKPKIVLNSSVVIALSTINLFKVLNRIFHLILISQAVYDEVCVYGRGMIGDEELRKAVKDNLVKLGRIKNLNLMRELCEKLSIGEAESIVLALEVKADYIALDDKLARKIAKMLGLNVIGTLRILRLLYENNVISKELFILSIERLRGCGFRVSDVVIKKVLEGIV